MNTLPIPKYYSSEFAGQVPETISDPSRTIEALNKKIIELHPKKELIKTICLLAVTIFGAGASIALIALGVPALLPSLSVAFYVSMAAFSISFYREFRAKCSEVQKEMTWLRLPNEFIYVDRIYSNGGLSLDDFNLIRRRLPRDYVTSESIHLKVERERRYKKSGGKVDTWSAVPIRLSVVGDVVTNQKSVLETYKPWIELLLDVEKSNALPFPQKQQLGKAIGWMIHNPQDVFAKELMVIDSNSAMIASLSSGTLGFGFFAEGGTSRIEVFGNGKETRYSTVEELAAFLKNKYGLGVEKSSSLSA
jgi:hypothetical protein